MKFGELDFEREPKPGHKSKSMNLFGQENEPSGDCVGENRQIRQGRTLSNLLVVLFRFLPIIKFKALVIIQMYK